MAVTLERRLCDVSGSNVETNPLRALKQAQHLLDDVADFKADVIASRAKAAFAANRAGVSYVAIAKELGCSKSLAQQLVEEGRRLAS